MDEKVIGVAVSGATSEEVLGQIERSERLGIPAVWMTTGGARLDSITTFAAAAGRTQNIKFGTSIVPTYPRHPLVMAQQTQVVAQLARAVSAWVLALATGRRCGPWASGCAVPWAI